MLSYLWWPISAAAVFWLHFLSFFLSSRVFVCEIKVFSVGNFTRSQLNEIPIWNMHHAPSENWLSQATPILVLLLFHFCGYKWIHRRSHKLFMCVTQESNLYSWNVTWYGGKISSKSEKLCMLKYIWGARVRYYWLCPWKYCTVLCSAFSTYQNACHAVK